MEFIEVDGFDSKANERKYRIFSIYYVFRGKKLSSACHALHKRHYHCICVGPLMIINMPPSKFARHKIKSFQTFLCITVCC